MLGQRLRQQGELEAAGLFQLAALALVLLVQHGLLDLPFPVPLEVLGHAVEGLRQEAEFAARAHRDACLQVTLGDAEVLLDKDHILPLWGPSW